MTGDKLPMFRNRLLKVYRHLDRQARKQYVSCYRLYDHDLPEFPFCIELYGGRVYIAEYQRKHAMSDEEHDKWLEQSRGIIQEVLGVSAENISLRERRKKQGRSGQYRKLGENGNEFVVRENGLQFIVNLDDYLDTGLFLDHRITRQYVRDESANKRVLNLFAYTGSFSVYAAAGGASEVVTVDLSATYLDWARRNMKLNGFIDPASYRFIRADILQYLPLLATGYFDVIVLDPPTFSNSKRMDDHLDIQRDHVVLLNSCLKMLREGGIIYFSTNSKKFVLDSANINSTMIRDITRATTPFDFTGKPGRLCFKITR